MFKRFAIIAPMAIVAGMASAQVTSSSVVGRITDQNGEAVIGANIVAVHTPSGTRYGGMTNNNGSFNLNILWEGHHYVSWDLPDGDPNKTFNLITKEQFTSLSAGTKLLIHYTLEPSAEYHQMQLTTMWWTELPGTAKTDLTEDGVMELATTA